MNDSFHSLKVPVTRSEAEQVAPGPTGMIRDGRERFVNPQHPVDKCDHGNSASRCSRCLEPQRQPSIVDRPAVAPEPPPPDDLYVYDATIEAVTKRFQVPRKELLRLDHVLCPQVVAGAGGMHRRYSLRRVREAIESGAVQAALDELANAPAKPPSPRAKRQIVHPPDYISQVGVAKLLGYSEESTRSVRAHDDQLQPEIDAYGRRSYSRARVLAYVASLATAKESA